MKIFRRSKYSRASSLVTTLLVIVVLSTIVIAFLQSMSVERLTAKSRLNIERANLAANAGANEAMEILRSLMGDYPDSATGWVTNMAPTNSTNRTPGTAFYYYSTITVTNTNFTPNSVPLNFRPLVSGATNVTFSNRATAMSGVANLTNWVNLNGANFGSGKPWIGTPPNSGTNNFPIQVPWVDMRDSQGNLVGRYAYWIDDESFRVNLQTATNAVRGNSTLGANPSEVPIQGALVSAISDGATRDTVADKMVTLREKLGTAGSLLSSKTVNYADSSYTNLHDNIGFISTIHSSGLNVSRTGARRVNLNTLVAANTSPTNATTIRTELDKIIGVITNQAPNFGQRFYRIPMTATNNPGVTPLHARIYLNKIAANIRDYIDSDSMPTLVKDDGTIYADGTPSTVMGTPGGGNEFWAIGKENVPRLQEAVLHVPQIIAMQDGASPWQIRISYYLEFWNMGTKDISVSDLGPNPFFRIMNQPGWFDPGASPDKRIIKEDTSRDFSIPLNVLRNGNNQPLTVFPAGSVTVLSSDPSPENYVGGSFLPTTAIANGVYRPPAASVSGAPHEYGSTFGRPYLNYPPSGYSAKGTLVMDTRSAQASHPTSAMGNDYRTEVILGNDYGWLDSSMEAVAAHPGIFVDNFGNPPVKVDRKNFHVRGGALVGNRVPVGMGSVLTAGSRDQVGDPRAKNEQMQFQDDQTTGTYQTRWNSERTTDSGVTQSSPATGSTRFSLGSANSDYMNPSSATGSGLVWDEGNNTRTVSSLASGGAPAYYANGSLRTIGELGHIYDPVRQGSTATEVARALGGGRTLRVGQSEAITSAGSALAIWDGNNESASRRWTSWRLLDFFSTRDELEPSHLHSTLGVINPNGALRDGGAALKAVMEGIAFSTNDAQTDQLLKNQLMRTNEMAYFSTILTNRLGGTNLPFFERGEFSELNLGTVRYFNSPFAPGFPVSGLNFSTGLDRGREELFRRLAELITTKGNTFTVYCVGQALTTQPNGKLRVDATATRRVTFRLSPQYASTSLDFDPASQTSVAARMASPTSYVIQVLRQTDQ